MATLRNQGFYTNLMKMKISKIVFVIFSIIVIASCSRQVPTNVTKIKIEFDGGADEFYDKYNLWQEVTDTVLISKIITLRDSLVNSKQDYFCALKKVKWEIDVYMGDENGCLHSFTISTNDDDIIHVLYGRNCYVHDENNDELVKLLKKLVHFEKIKEYSGKLRQEEYDELLKEK